jgi:hypothetical protein
VSNPVRDLCARCVHDQVGRRFFPPQQGGGPGFFTPRRFSSFASQLEFIDKLCIREF